MKIYLLILILLFNLSSCSKLNFYNSPERFLPNHSDVPLFKDFNIIDNETLNFDSASGHISNITYNSQSTFKNINKYYENNLKNLGWKILDKKENYISFQRKAETLRISYEKMDNFTKVKFFIIKNNG